jgi:hypothetical protein
VTSLVVRDREGPPKLKITRHDHNLDSRAAVRKTVCSLGDGPPRICGGFPRGTRLQIRAPA